MDCKRKRKRKKEEAEEKEEEMEGQSKDLKEGHCISVGVNDVDAQLTFDSLLCAGACCHMHLPHLLIVGRGCLRHNQTPPTYEYEDLNLTYRKFPFDVETPDSS